MPMRISLYVSILLLSTVLSIDAGAAGTVTVAAVGDVMMGTAWPEEILPPRDGEGIFDNVLEGLHGADILFGNLEGPLLDEGEGIKCGKKRKKNKSCFEFRMPTRYVGHLKTAGFDVLNIANNHSFDFGPDGIRSTIETLEQAGVQATGGENIAAFFIEDKSVAFLGFSYSPPSSHSHPIQDVPAAVETIGEVKGEYDLVVVSFHGGGEGKDALYVEDADEIFAGANRGNVVRFAREAIDAGADLVFGHGPHVPRALEVYKGKLIAYSLGNFLTYGRFNIQGPSGLSFILRAEIDADTGFFVRGAIVPVELRNRGIPFIDPEMKSVALIRELIAARGVPAGLTVEEDGTIRIPPLAPFPE